VRQLVVDSVAGTMAVQHRGPTQRDILARLAAPDVFLEGRIAKGDTVALTALERLCGIFNMGNLAVFVATSDYALSASPLVGALDTAVVRLGAPGVEIEFDKFDGLKSALAAVDAQELFFTVKSLLAYAALAPAALPLSGRLSLLLLTPAALRVGIGPRFSRGLASGLRLGHGGLSGHHCGLGGPRTGCASRTGTTVSAASKAPLFACCASGASTTEGSSAGVGVFAALTDPVGSLRSSSSSSSMTGSQPVLAPAEGPESTASSSPARMPPAAKEHLVAAADDVPPVADAPPRLPCNQVSGGSVSADRSPLSPMPGASAAIDRIEVVARLAPASGSAVAATSGAPRPATKTGGGSVFLVCDSSPTWSGPPATLHSYAPAAGAAGTTGAGSATHASSKRRPWLGPPCGRQRRRMRFIQKNIARGGAQELGRGRHTRRLERSCGVPRREGLARPPPAGGGVSPRLSGNSKACPSKGGSSRQSSAAAGAHHSWGEFVWPSEAKPTPTGRAFPAIQIQCSRPRPDSARPVLPATAPTAQPAAVSAAALAAAQLAAARAAAQAEVQAEAPETAPAVQPASAPAVTPAAAPAAAPAAQTAAA
jgi:hypothetical protein